MAKALRPVNHDARLSLVEHLDELRTRLIFSIGALIVAFGVCFWQNHRSQRRAAASARASAMPPQHLSRSCTAQSRRSTPATARTWRRSESASRSR
jgi:Sec-independent protein secretion pathway component TatC